MTLTELRSRDWCPTTKPSLNGGSLNAIRRVGDLQNIDSIGSRATYSSKGFLREHAPYVVVNDGSVYINKHFLCEARRQLSGVIEPSSSQFSPYEESFFSTYVDWTAGAVATDITLIALIAFDFWLVEEIQEHTHPTADRDFTTTHKWRKTDIQEVNNGIRCIDSFKRG